MKTLVILALIVISNVQAIEYVYDLSAGNDKLVTKECGGEYFVPGYWEFENATKYGYNDGTVYTSTNPACISPKQLLKFTKDSTLNIVGYEHYTPGDGLQVAIVNSGGLFSRWYYEVVTTPKSVNITVDGTTITDDWVFENEHNLEIIYTTLFTGRFSLRYFTLNTPDETTTSSDPPNTTPVTSTNTPTINTASPTSSSSSSTTKRPSCMLNKK